MTWTNPATATAGQVLADTTWNTTVRDNLNILATHTHDGSPGHGDPLIPIWTSGKLTHYLLPLSTATTAPVNLIGGAITATFGYDSTFAITYTAISSAFDKSFEATWPPLSTALAPVISLALADISGTHNLRVGLTNAPATLRTGDTTHGVYFRKLGTANWFAVTRNASTETATNTGVAHDSAWHRFEIRVAGTGSVTFRIDGTQVAAHTTNIPTASTVLLAALADNVSSGTSELRVGHTLGLRVRDRA